MRRWPRLSRAGLVLAGLFAALIGLANAYVLLGPGGDSTSDVAEVPHAQVAIVPGAFVKPDGTMSLMLADRVNKAVALWDSGKVDRILVSGDHHTWAYDEPDTMRKALVRAGVPGRVVFEDHAGFDTWATMSRARSIFGVRSAIVVTQGFHMPRALYLADEAGIEATGLTSDLHGYGIQGMKSGVREVLSRVKAIADVTLDTPAVGGRQIPITGDGRASWGPAPPPGTPPAGSPGPRKRTAATPRATFAPAVATGAFGLDLMRAQGPGNLVLSPDSVAAALAMTGTGGVGRTATEIARTLHLEGPSKFAAVGDLQRAILAGQAAAAVGDAKPPTLEIANGLFLQRGLPFKPAFLSGALRHFGATPETVDFTGDPTGALEAINGWVSEHTKGLIPQILDSLPPEMALALANAVYLDADWEHPFEKGKTRPGVFHKAGGEVTVDFMHESESLHYGAGPGYRAVALPYRSSTLSLLVMLPMGQRLGALQHRLDGRSLARIARGLSATPVILSLPRFHLKTEVELKAVLKTLGMPTAFNEAANFSGIATGGSSLEIDFVKHAADFTVDEAGTVAAAATVVGIGLSLVRPPHGRIVFNANHPFLFFLRDDRTGAVLFAGRVTDPSAVPPDGWFA